MDKYPYIELIESPEFYFLRQLELVKVGGMTLPPIKDEFETRHYLRIPRKTKDVENDYSKKPYLICIDFHKCGELVLETASSIGIISLLFTPVSPLVSMCVIGFTIIKKIVNSFPVRINNDDDLYFYAYLANTQFNSKSIISKSQIKKEYDIFVELMHSSGIKIESLFSKVYNHMIDGKLLVIDKNGKYKIKKHIKVFKYKAAIV